MIITAKFETRCPNCDGYIDAGTKVEWTRGSKARHVKCPVDAFGDDSSDLECFDVELAEVQPVVDAVTAAFKALEKVLASTTLKTESGKRYKASASEFMFMHKDQNGYAFKHGETRNYLFVKGNELHIPVTSQPFMRGTFGKLGE